MINCMSKKLIFSDFGMFNIYLKHYRNFPNKRPGRLLTQHPRQGGAYLGQMTFSFTIINALILDHD